MNTLLTHKIYTAQGISKDPALFAGKRVLHMGCGKSKLPGATGIDLLALPGVDVVHNLDVFPWPFADNTFDAVVAHATLEHLDDIVSAMEEIWRISKHDARVVINVPYFRHPDAFGDPTHRHYFTSQSMDNFITGTKSNVLYEYSGVRYTLAGFWYGLPMSGRNRLVRLVKRCIHAHPRLYDTWLSLLAPVKIVAWELIVEKK